MIQSHLNCAVTLTNGQNDSSFVRRKYLSSAFHIIGPQLHAGPNFVTRPDPEKSVTRPDPLICAILGPEGGQEMELKTIRDILSKLYCWSIVQTKIQNKIQISRHFKVKF